MIQIGTKQASQERPLVIAEIGSNWRNQEEVTKSIQEAAACGADVAKFQMLNFRSLYGGVKAPSWWDKHIELPVEWLSGMKSECDNNQIELMISCFGPDLVRVVDPVVNCHKVASSEITHIDLLEEIACHGKPVFISVGGASKPDIENALSVLKGTQVILNYCVGAYPSTDTDLFVMDELARYGFPVAFSDHSMDYTYLPRAAVKYHGAIAVEKHVKFVKSTGPDSHHSLDSRQFRDMVRYLRGQKHSQIGPGPTEDKMITHWQRRLVALTDIAKGDNFIYNENVGACRSLTGGIGDSPFLARGYRDTQAARDIKAGDCIRRNDFN